MRSFLSSHHKGADADQAYRVRDAAASPTQDFGMRLPPLSQQYQAPALPTHGQNTRPEGLFPQSFGSVGAAYSLDANNNSFHAFSSSSDARHDGSAYAFPPLENGDAVFSTTGLEAGFDPYFMISEVPDDIKLAVSERLKTADANNATVFQDIADSVTAEFGIPVTHADVVKQFEHDRTAVDIQLFLNAQHSDNAASGAAAASVEPVPRAASAPEFQKYSIPYEPELFRDKKYDERVEDPEHAGNIITVTTWRRRIKLREMIDDPENPGVSISRGDLRRRDRNAIRVPDPLNSSNTIKKDTLRTRERDKRLVDDPVTGQQISFKQLYYRNRNAFERVPDALREGETISLNGLKQRERRNALVNDPENPGMTIRQYELDSRKGNMMVEHPFKPGVLVKASSVRGIRSRSKLVPDPKDDGKLILQGELWERNRKERQNMQRPPLLNRE